MLNSDESDEIYDDPTHSGVVRITQERNRQVTGEGWDAQHDDTHDQGELAIAASVYAMPLRHRGALMRFWPWASSWYKPNPGDAPTVEGRIRELVKAGALIAAEIDRLERRRAGGRGEA